jgi:predicted permease
VLADLLYRLRTIFRRKTVEEELDDELRFHCEREVEKQMNSGLVREEALRRARLSFGGLDQVKEECRRARGVSAVETTVQDLHYAIRSMRRNPAFTVVAVLTLGLGTGAISTVFTLANTLFFRNLPVDRPDEVVFVQATRLQGRARGWVSYRDYVHFRDQTKTLIGLAAHCPNAPLFVAARQRSKQINGAVVSANFFTVLGMTPALGRFFRQDEDSVPDRDRVAVLSYELWRNWFGSSPDALGRTLKINGVAFMIIGVAPRTFRGVNVQPAEIYIPTMMLPVGTAWCIDALAGVCPILDMIGRLAEGRTVEEARAEMAALVPHKWAKATKGGNTGATVLHAKGASDPDVTRGGKVRFIKLLAWVAGVLLLVCCANLAGLLISRNSARSREFAIRTFLGAGSMRLIRQLMTESLLLAVSGGAVGVLFSLALTGALNSMFYSLDVQGRPLYFDFTPEPVVILAVVTVSIAAGLLLGFIPALKSIRSDAAGSLKRQSSAVSAGSRLGRWLVGAQAAVAVALVAVAGLLTASARGLIAGTNFEASHVALMRLRPGLLKYSPENAQQFQRTAIGRLEAVPGVESASMVGTGAVLFGREAQVSLPEWADSQALACGYIEIGPRYFQTLRTPVLRGREFDDRDTLRSPPVAIVNETLARRFWPNGSVIGAILMVKSRPHQVVGIAVTLESRPIVIWLSRKTSLMNRTICVFAPVIGNPTSAGFHTPHTSPRSSGRPLGL